MKTIKKYWLATLCTMALLMMIQFSALAQGSENAINVFEMLGIAAAITIFLFVYYLLFSFFNMILGEAHRKASFITAGIINTVLFTILSYYLFFRS